MQSKKKHPIVLQSIQTDHEEEEPYDEEDTHENNLNKFLYRPNEQNIQKSTNSFFSEIKPSSMTGYVPNKEMEKWILSDAAEEKLPEQQEQSYLWVQEPLNSEDFLKTSKNVNRKSNIENHFNVWIQ